MAERNVDLNSLLQEILTCDEDLKNKKELQLQATEAVIHAEGRLREAQRRFDTSVSIARGIPVGDGPVKSDLPQRDVRDIVADETPRVAMGPLPPTSPCLKPGWTGAATSNAADDDDREDGVYDDPHAT